MRTMGKHANHRTPTCRKCGTQHYNMRPCPEPAPAPARRGSLQIIHRDDTGLRSLDMTIGSVAASGNFVGGSRIDKHPQRRMAATATEEA